MIKRKWTIALALLGVAVGGLLYLSFDRGDLRFNYPSYSRFPVRGIDVSHHQGDINWLMVKGDGVQFAFIKATEGGDQQDKKFQENWNGAKTAGIKRGAYHFFTFCRPGLDQAKNFLSMVPRGEAELPPVLDLEFGGNCRREPSAQEIGSEIKNFLVAIRPLFSGRPILYVTPEFFDRYLANDRSSFPEHVLWLRNVWHEPSQAVCEKWSFWQFANRAWVDGITKPVDLNVFCGSQDFFSRAFR